MASPARCNAWCSTRRSWTGESRLHHQHALFERILKKTTAFFVEHNPAEIQNANQRGSRALSVIVQLSLMELIPGALQIVLTLVTLGALINVEVVAITATYGAVAVTIAIVGARRSRAFLDRAIEAGQENARFVGGAINAMETLRHFGSHRWMHERFSEKARVVRDSWRAYVLQHVRYLAALGLGLAIQFAVTFWLLLPRHAAGALSIGDIVLFNTLLLQLNQPFEMIARAVGECAHAPARRSGRSRRCGWRPRSGRCRTRRRSRRATGASCSTASPMRTTTAAA